MLSYNVNLEFETKESRDFWIQRMVVVKKAYNFISKKIHEEKIPLNIKEVHNKCYKQTREQFPEIPAQMCIETYRMVLANYRTVKSNNHKIDKPLEMKNPAIQLDKHLYSNLTRTSVKLSSETPGKRAIVKFKTYPKFLELAEKYRICDPKIVYREKTDTLYMSIPFYTTYPTPENEDAIGIDLGCKRFVTLSNGKAYVDKDYLKARRCIRYLKRMLQEHKKHSHSARTKLKKNRRRERNLSKNMCHMVANKILEEKESIIVMEDLSKIKKKTSKTKEGFKRKKHNNRLSQIPFYQFKEILSYKALLVGKQVATVSPSFTSQMDCRTQTKDGCERKGCRFKASDGMMFDADWNAAINIAIRKHPISFDLPIDGRLNIVGRVCQPPNRGLSGKPDNLQAATSSE